MGRTELRKLDRKNRIENRKGKVLLSKEAIAKIKKNESDRVTDFNVEALLTCFALAEHRLYGYGSKRVLKTLTYLDDLMGEISNDNKTIDDYKRELEEEVGLQIKM